MILSKRCKASGRGSFRKERPRKSESISKEQRSSRFSSRRSVEAPTERAAQEWHP